jgi:hypothetical protein
MGLFPHIHAISNKAVDWIALRHDDCPGVTTVGPEAERHPVNPVQTGARTCRRHF